MGHIVDVIFASNALKNDNWEEFALVFEFNERGDVFATSGFTYDASGNSYPTSVKPRLIRSQVNAFLLDALKDVEAKPKAMLFQFNRETNRVESELEYENFQRWRATPTTFKEVPIQIKPNFHELP